MKRLLLLFICLILSLTVLTSCDILYGVLDALGDANGGIDDTPVCEHVDKNDNYRCDRCGDSHYDGEEPDDESEDDKNGQEGSGNGENEGNKHKYTAFTASEKALFNRIAGGVIPFIPNDEYYVEEYFDEYYYETCVNFYTYGNTEAEFEAYKDLFVGYELIETYEDDYGDTWYCLNGATYVEMSYYYYEGDYVIDVYVYTPIADGDDNTGSGDSGDNGSQGGENEDIGYIYTEFTAEERALFMELIGYVIPFAPNNSYYVEEYTYDWGDEVEKGVNFYTYGNTQADFNAYKALFNSFTYEGTDTDDYGDAWYYYTADEGYFVDMSYYSDGEDYVIDVYAYLLYDSEGGGSGDSGNGGSGSGSTDSNLITNAGAGLPDGTNGVYDVDFTDATYVKDVTDQGYYLDGCPTVGSPKVLVIPVDFTDINGRSSSYYSIDKISRAFNGSAGETDYYSVDEYYYISSYGRLDLDITVIDEWFVPRYDSSYYENATMDYYGEEVAIGDQLVMDEALKYLSTVMDLSQFDSDGNTIIDAVVLITTLEIKDTSDFNWAYRYWNIYTDDEGYYYEYDGVSANDYLWASYSFMHESYDEEGYVDYTDTSVMNTYTFIHEFGHILGADDYYNTAELGEHPMDGCDIMDGMMGDHNAFTKFNLGWVTASRLITTDGSVTLTLDAFSKAGDSIILASNWDITLGAYQEYYIIVYYTGEGLNSGEGGYFARDGIIVYHVNASLYSEDYEDETYYDIYNNNTHPSDQYGTEDNLIEFVKSGEGNFTYVEGDILPTVTDDQGNTLPYTFTVNALDDGSAIITFTRI